MNSMNQALNLMADAFIPSPSTRPASQRSMSMDRSGSVAARNRRRNSMLVESVLQRRTTTAMSEACGPSEKCSAPQRGGFGFGRGAQVRRWDGNTRAKSDWDSLRRDPELWFAGANALIHLYSKGQSRRGPSFRLPLDDIEQSNCGPLLTEALTDGPDTLAPPPDSSSDDGSASNAGCEGQCELHIPAPAVLERQDAFRYHLTTRNFFAWMFDKPLVGDKLGEALIALHERMNLWRPHRDQNQDDVLAYMDSQGYTDFRDSPDHALGVLQYAERFELGELWTDAFVHCAGMNDRLVTSGDFNGVTRTTKALITRANLEMTVRMERSSMSLSNFMEDDLDFLKLQDPVNRHIERFRSFLHSFYVQRHGYWPPAGAQSQRGRGARPNPLSKLMLLSMYTDFRNLYELLADWEALPGRVQLSNAVSDGFDVSQAVSSFDRRQKFAALPYVLPQLPESLPEVSEPRFSLLSSVFRRSRVDNRTNVLAALHRATNASLDHTVIESPLVVEYFRFEREYTLHEDDRISATDARKARWLLVYGILQTLVDVTKAPPEVQDTEGVEYPLCCQTAGTPPWSPATPYAAHPTQGRLDRQRLVRRVSSQQSFESFASNHSGAPSARVDPLDLALVASKRLSLVQTDAVRPAFRSRSSSITHSPLHMSAPIPVRSMSQTAVLSPKPRRPSVQEQALIAAYDSEEPLEASDSDVPPLSPSIGRTESDGGRRSSEEGSSASDADSPTSPKFGLTIFQEDPSHVQPPPSPSIYDSDEEGPSKSEFNLLMGGSKVDSNELARQWQGEIGTIM